MKVYLVERHYDNGLSYEDNEQHDDVEAICISEVVAKNYIANIKNDYKHEGDPYIESDYPIKCERCFYNDARWECDEPEILYYRIKEMEVLM